MWLLPEPETEVWVKVIRNLYCIMYQEEDIEASSLRLQHSIRYDTILCVLFSAMPCFVTVVLCSICQWLHQIVSWQQIKDDQWSLTEITAGVHCYVLLLGAFKVIFYLFLLQFIPFSSQWVLLHHQTALLQAVCPTLRSPSWTAATHCPGVGPAVVHLFFPGFWRVSMPSVIRASRERKSRDESSALHAMSKHICHLKEFQDCCHIMGLQVLLVFFPVSCLVYSLMNFCE